jgi:folate-binding protein YgfZ
VNDRSEASLVPPAPEGFADVTSDPTTDRGYRSAVEEAAFFERRDRHRLRVSGRAPRQMLNGILTGTLPAPAEEGPEGFVRGTATYHAVLTPKGKMLTDCWAYLLGHEEDPGFVLDVSAAGAGALGEHLRKFLPPRLARLEDVSGATEALVVVGPRAASILSRIAFGLRVEEESLAALPEGGWLLAGSPEDGFVVARTRDVSPDAYTVMGDARAVAAMRRRLTDAGVPPVRPEVWTTLRVEAGRPEFGVDMDETTIPVEAGIHDRAIDHGKGCYTGQEVIVRIRDRGHVNRHLRQLRLGAGPVPLPGTELSATGEPGRIVGRITSAVWSPTAEQVVALAYVRRGVDQVLYRGVEFPVRP